MKRLLLRMIVLSAVFLASCAAEKPAEPDAVKDRIAAFVGNANFAVTAKYETGFESLDDFEGFYIVPQDHMSTTSHSLTGTVKKSGGFSHYSWIYGANPVITGTNTNHRGYPTIQLNTRQDGAFQGLVFCEFDVMLNITITAEADKNWFSFATFCSYSDDYWYRSYLVNLDSNYRVHVMHVPGQGQSVQDIFQADDVFFPMNQWVKISVLIDYTASNQYGSPYIKAWQDGVAVSAARFNPRVDPAIVPQEQWPDCLDTWDGSTITQAESLCGLVYEGGLSQAHFGMYAAPLIDSGEVWNDNLVIYELTRQ